jgi:beta-aspartyl-peptidase (threonine type)
LIEPQQPPVLLVHGGAGAATKDETAYRRGLLEAAERGHAVLRGGGAAVDAVVAAVRSMEDDPVFNAGRGSVLNTRGEVECDAAVMRGGDQKFGAVAAVKGIRNPVLLAQHVLRSRRVMLAAEGATRFAEDMGMSRCDPAQLITQERFSAWATWMAQGQPALAGEDVLEGCDTVGAVALDAESDLAAATSTGGVSFKPPGRVGDSPLPGCGFWADQRAATSSTGEGEMIARVLLCRLAASGMELEGVGQSLEELERVTGGHAGVIGLRRDGAISVAYNTEIMGWAFRAGGMEVAECHGTRPRPGPA